MEMKHIKTDKFSFLYFENVYTEEELKDIWLEAKFLCYENKLSEPDKTGSATRDDKTLKKKNKGVWLDDLYKENRHISNYLKLYNKIENEHIKKILEISEKNDMNFRLFFQTNIDSTLLSYYENEDYYEEHEDSACFTKVFWLFEEPKCFEGGNLIFTDINYTIELKSNSFVLFPSWAKHKVETIKMKENIKPFTAKGRFAFSTFYNIKG